MHEFHFVLGVGGGAEGDGASAVAGADELVVGQVRARDDVGVVGAADEAVVARELVEELDGVVVGGADG